MFTHDKKVTKTTSLSSSANGPLFQIYKPRLVSFESGKTLLKLVFFVVVCEQ